LTSTLQSLLSDLSDLYAEMAMVAVQESNDRIRGYRESLEQSVTGREWDAKIASQTSSAEVIRIRWEIEAMKVDVDRERLRACL
jgi:hypothetical protein